MATVTPDLDLDLRTRLFIDGGFVGRRRRTFPTVNPATGQVLAEVAAWDAADVDFAVAQGAGGLRGRPLATLPPAERKACCCGSPKLIERNRHELAVLESLDSGKPIAECQTVDVPETINTIRWHAEVIDKIYDHGAPAGRRRTSRSWCASRSASSAACCRGTSRC